MPYLCFYFQVHQPKRLRPYTFFDIGQNHYYEDDEKNKAILLKVANKCYLPTNTILLDLIKKYPGIFKITFSISGTAIEQFKRFSPETLDSFKRLVDTGSIEILNETYHHSLSAVFSEKVFREEIAAHRTLMQQVFNITPTAFRNTELIYNNHVAHVIESLGYEAILAEGADKILEWRSPNFLYQPKGTQRLKILLKNYALSDDIAFRFSNKTWCDYPLTAEKFADWVNRTHPAEIINFFMDYETFGEHQWEETGIFEFLKALPHHLLKHHNMEFCTPSEAVKILSPVATLDAPHFYSWADTERDLSAWMGNPLQDDALRTVYALEDAVEATNHPELKNTWKSLLTSDHFYYMCTKWHADGDVHQYFNPYKTSYDAYVNFQNIVKDFALTVKKYDGKI